MENKVEVPKSVKIMKLVVGMAASISTGMVVTNLISSNLVLTGGKVQKVAMSVGTYFLSNNVGGWVADRVETQIEDIYIAGVEALNEVAKELK